MDHLVKRLDRIMSSSLLTKKDLLLKHGINRETVWGWTVLGKHPRIGHFDKVLRAYGYKLAIVEIEEEK